MQIKRSISVILTAVLLCMAILMTSCDALSVKKVEEDPTEQLMSSTSSTATNVVNSISPLDPVKAALKKGLFEISYSNDEIGNISNRFYIDAEAKKAADIASVELMGEKIDLGIYGADSKLAVSSSLLGDSAYGFDFTTLAEDARTPNFGLLSALHTVRPKLRSAISSTRSPDFPKRKMRSKRILRISRRKSRRSSTRPMFPYPRIRFPSAVRISKPSSLTMNSARTP